MSTYAADTNVSSEKSRGEIERTLSRYGAHIVFHSYGCWEWVGPVNANGYALLGNGQTGHRYFYQVFRGEIPDDLVLDHVCHTTLCPGGPTCPHRRCIRPDHLNITTRGANVLRGSNLRVIAGKKNECTYGHEMTPANTYVSPKGHRQCRECRKRREKNRRPRNVR